MTTDQTGATEPTGRALVVLPAAKAARSGERSLAGFLTQLIASKRRLRAYRRAGRSEPGEAARVYAGRAGELAPGLDVTV